MDKPSLETVLACPKLPTLPAVAVKVLELTQHTDVKLAELAQVIQNDQALAAKVLRTINSSYYGLNKPCADIRQALAYLGLNAVKSLVLGFSLAQAVDGGGDSDVTFDFIDYWRRGIYSAAAAKHIARRSRRVDPDEAFLGALMQDIGMVALYRAMGDSYLIVMDLAEGDHRRLPACESRSLDFDHAIVGGEMARRWKLPPQLVAAIKHHHDSSESRREWSVFVQVVELAGMLAAAMTLPNPQSAISKFERCGHEWFDFSADQIRLLMEQVAEDGRQIARLFNLDAGAHVDVDEVMKSAQAAMQQHEQKQRQELDCVEQGYQALRAQGHFDTATLLGNETGFEAALSRRIDTSRNEQAPLGVILIRFDALDALRSEHGEAAYAGMLSELGRRLKTATAEHGLIYRIGPGEFAVLLPGLDRLKSATLAEAIRGGVCAEPVVATGVSIRLTASFGVAALEPATFPAFGDPSALRRAADGAVRAAHAAGSDCVRVFTPRRPSEAA